MSLVGLRVRIHIHSGLNCGITGGLIGKLCLDRDDIAIEDVRFRLKGGDVRNDWIYFVFGVHDVKDITNNVEPIITIKTLERRNEA
jgi:hypothetical protein